MDTFLEFQFFHIIIIFYDAQIEYNVKKIIFATRRSKTRIK